MGRVRSIALNRFGLLFILPFPLYLVEIIIKPYLYGYTGHGYEFWWYLIFFLIGFILIRNQEQYFVSLQKIRIPVTVLAVTFSFILSILIDRAGKMSDLMLNGGWGREITNIFDPSVLLFSFTHSYHTWFWCLTLFSWAAKVLNKQGKILKYLNEAVYPLYIWHMTFVFFGLYLISSLTWSLGIKFIVVTLFTFLFSFAGVELVKKTKLTRKLFGIKEKRVKCTNCDNLNEPHNDFCVKCGSQLSSRNSITRRPPNQPLELEETENQNAITCALCKHINVKVDIFCIRCGNKLISGVKN